MEQSLDPTLLAVAMGAFFLGGVIKGTMGFGLPILAIPALTAASSLPMALSIALVPVILTNFWQLWTFRNHGEGRFLPRFLGFGAVGLVVGALVLSWVRGAYLEIALGTMVLGYLALRAAQPTVGSGAQAQLMRFSPAFGFVAGTVHGATGLSGLVGPPYFHALALERPVFVFCNTAMFTLFSVMHVPTLYSLGLLQVSALWIGLFALPAAFAGLWIGGRIGPRITSAAFSTGVLAILGMTAFVPILNGVRDLMGG